MKTIGKVIEVYIPEQYKNNKLLDVMDRTVIGFKIMTEQGLKTIELEQDENNANIYKDSMVLIIEQNISGKKFIDLELFDGDANE